MVRHTTNLAANAARFLKCVWPFWDIMHQRVNGNIAAPCVWKVFWDKSLICFIFRSILSQMIFKIGVLKNIGNFTEKYLCWSLFSRKFIKKRLQHRCFPLKFTLITYQSSVSQFFSKAKTALFDDTFLLAIEEIVGVFHICIVSLCPNNIKIKVALHLVLEDNVSYTIVNWKNFPGKVTSAKISEHFKTAIT